MDEVSIVMPVYANSKQITKVTIDCLRDLMKTYGVKTEIIVVDDGSREPVSKIISKLFPQVRILINEQNLGFAKAVNRGIREAQCNLVCLLNNDIRLPNSKWLSSMVQSMDEFDMTAPAGGRMDSKWNYQPGEAKTRAEKFSYLAGWCLLVKRRVFDEIGLMPENFSKGFFEDVLFSYRAKRAGFKLGITEGTDIQHLYHTTFKAEGFNLAEEYNKKRKIFLDIIRKEG